VGGGGGDLAAGLAVTGAGTVVSDAGFSCEVNALTVDRGDVGVGAAGEAAAGGAVAVMEPCLLAGQPSPSRTD